jgi:C1A family cysteine protease
MGHNQFSDMTKNEIKNLRPRIQRLQATNNNSFFLSSLHEVPESLSYLDSCLPVVNQGHCASCWAFASAAQVETQLKRKNPAFDTPISPQYLLDCAPNDGCGSNGGGWPSDALG